MPDPNPNRELPAEAVQQLVTQRLPSLAPGLGADRTWLWWSGPKPDESDRKALVDLGFSFTPRPHALPDGRAAHWFHPCGGAVVRRRKKGAVSSRQHSTTGRSAEQPPARPAESTSDDSLARLMRLADAL